jgi:FlaA1/EpsC-like NDP-sugar epimerase
MIRRARARAPWVEWPFFDAVASALVAALSALVSGALPSPLWMLGLAVLRPTVFHVAGIYRREWRYATRNDVARLGLALVGTGIGAGGVAVGLHGLLGPSGDEVVPSVSALALELALSGIMLAGGRLLTGIEQRPLDLGSDVELGEPPRPVLLYGAGELGALLAREMRSNRLLGLRPVGFVDDDPAKRGNVIHGVTVVGDRGDIADLVRTHAVEEVIVAQSHISAARYEEVKGVCEALDVPVRSLPGMPDLLGETVAVSRVRPVRVEQLLGRRPHTIPEPPIRDLVAGLTVLVTGAGGSIGSEAARQIASRHARRIVLLDKAETPLFFIDEELRRRFPDVEIVPVLADIVDAAQLHRAFSAHRPDVVLHAAAHKHVPLSEQNVAQAARVNIIGTRIVAEASAAAGTGVVIYVSTDKAVDPSSVMGATKRIGELVIQQVGGRLPETRFVVVRFGNVLGSQGSVVQLFREQIARGGPVTITHPQMTRYFMTIPEAVQLILLAGAVGRAGEIYVLNMGQPVRIVDLARDMIRLSLPGREDEIRLEFTGLRPGEKMEETLFASDEEPVPTEEEYLLVARASRNVAHTDESQGLIEEVEAAALSGDDAATRTAISRALPNLADTSAAGTMQSRSTASRMGQNASR